MSKLNTTIIAKALDNNIKETQTIAASNLAETPKVEDQKTTVESKNDIIEEKVIFADSEISTLKKQVNKNTTSLELIYNQLNNITDLLQSKTNIEDDLVVNDNEAYNNRIGRSAEEFLFKELKQLFKDEPFQVTWLNENGEKGLYYDFIIEGYKGKFFYECKGTASNLNEFQLTKNEWDFYLENLGKYRLCFVNNIDSDPSYIRFMDLLNDMKAKKLIPCSTKNKAYKANRIVFQVNKD